MKQLLYVLTLLQIVMMIALYGLSNELQVARQAWQSQQAEIQLLRSDIKYLTHPETVQIRYLEYVMKVGEFK